MLVIPAVWKCSYYQRFQSACITSTFKVLVLLAVLKCSYYQRFERSWITSVYKFCKALVLPAVFKVLIVPALLNSAKCWYFQRLPSWKFQRLHSWKFQHFFTAIKFQLLATFWFLIHVCKLIDMKRYSVYKLIDKIHATYRNLMICIWHPKNTL